VAVFRSRVYPRAVRMQLSTLVIILGSVLTLTITRWSVIWDRRTLTQVAEDIRSGKEPRSSTYAKIVTPTAFVLMVAGIYLAVTGR
jgi:hypothetical protein